MQIDAQAEKMKVLLRLEEDQVMYRLNHGKPCPKLRRLIRDAEQACKDAAIEQEKHPMQTDQVIVSPVMVCDWDDALAFMEGEKKIEEVKFTQLVLPVPSEQEACS